MYYATTILKDAGFGDDATLAATIVAAVKLLATLVAVLNVDRCAAPMHESKFSFISDITNRHG